MIVTPQMIRAARMLLEWSIADLAEHAGVAVGTVVSIEHARGHRPKSWEAVTDALSAAGITWLLDGVQLTKPPKKRRR